MLGVYLAGSWGVLQVVDYMTGFAGLPDWTPSFAFVLLLIGLPIVTATAFVQKGMPSLQGEYRDEVDPNLLEGRTPEQVHVDPEAHPLHKERVFTWRNAILGGVGAGTLLITSVVAYFGMWAAGVGPMGNLVAQGVIAQGDAVVLATFTDATGEGLGQVVSEALRVDLSQAEVLRLVEESEPRDVLSRMQLAEGAPFTGEVAREAAVRQGIKAVLDGEVASAGTGYIITASLHEAQSGRSLASFRSAADGPEGVIRAIDRLSQDIREKSGESLRNIRAGEPLEAVTTGSLEALRRYADAEQAFDRGNLAGAIDVLQQAVTLDPAFAMAWRRLAVAYNNTGVDPDGVVEAATQAYEHRERLTERERYLAEAFYYSQVLGDRERTIAAYRNVLRLAPDDRAALNNLGNVFQEIEDFARADSLYRRAVEGPGRSPVAFQNLVDDALSEGRFQEAADFLDRYEDAYPDDATLFYYRFEVAFVSGDMEGALAQAEPVAGDLSQPAFLRAYALNGLGQVAYWLGHLDLGRRYSLEAERVAATVGPAFAWQWRLWTALSEELAGDPSWGLAHVQEGIRSDTFTGLTASQRSHRFTALVLAFGGDVAGVARVRSDYETSVPAERRGAGVRLELEQAGILARAAQGDPDGLAEALDANLGDFGCAPGRCFLPQRALVAEHAGDLAQALELHEAIRRRGFIPGEYNGPYRLRSTLRLGPLYEEAADTTKAIEAYQRVVDQWADADARGRKVVAAARVRIAALAQAGG